ncbi:MAG TPA: hypothetical protein VF040_05630 [Ktedonobacterales bacterium]
MRETESPESSLTPSSPSGTHDDAYDDESGGAPRVSSLHPTSPAFSMRRLLNVTSIAVAAVVLLALVTHWLPDLLPRQPTAADTQRIHARQTLDAVMPPARGTGWKPIGPDWATDIAFTSNGARGYVCGVNPPIPLVRFGVYDVHQQTWKELPSPASEGSGCEVFVSPDAGSYVTLVVNDCLTANGCPDTLPKSRLYESFDGGETWRERPLPGSMNVYDIAWANSTLFLATQGSMAADGTSIPINAPSHLLVSQSNGLFTEIPAFTEIYARQLVGRSMQLGYIDLLSNGTTLYASLGGLSCSSYCTIQVRSTDTGAHWTAYSAVYKNNPITPLAALPYSHILIGWAISQTGGTMTLVQSTDNGDSWRELPVLPENSFAGGANLFALPDGTIYAFCYGPASRVYALPAGATTWQAVASLPAGVPLAVQSDAVGHPVALWAQMNPPDISTRPGLEYYPLHG